MALAAAPEVVSQSTSPTAKPTAEARLEANVNAGEEAAGVTTECHFQYGKTVVTEHTEECEQGNALEGGEQGVAVTVKGLQAGTTYLYRVVLKNPSGKIEGNPEKVTTLPVPTTEVPSPVGSTTATFKGTLTPLNVTVPAEYYFVYNRLEEIACTGEHGTSTESAGTGSGVAHMSTAVTELEPHQKYTVCLVSTNTLGDNEEDLTPKYFETLPAPPKIDGEGAGANSTEATLSAEVNPNNENTKYTFEYSTTESSKKLTGTIVKIVGASELAGGTDQTAEVPTGAVLEAGKTYYYRVVAANAQSEIEPHPAEGEVQSFTTDPIPTTDPVTAIGATTATFNGHLTPLNANTATQYHFDYNLGSTCTGAGETPSAEAGKGAGGASEATAVTGLQPDRLYTVCFVTSNAFGSQSSPPTPAVTFRTLPETYATDVGSSSATLHAVLDPEGGVTTYRFQYGTSTSYSSETEAGSVEASGPVTVEAHVQELGPGGVYHFRVIATDASHETIASADQTFTTLPSGTGPGTGSALTDNRQYELVSPPDKHGALVEPIGQYGLIESSTEGDAFTYYTSAPTESQPRGNANASQILATRGADGWSDQDITTPNEVSTSTSVGNGEEYQAFSPDLSRGLLEPMEFMKFVGEETSPEATQDTPYVRSDSTCQATPATCYEPLLTTTDVTTGVKYGEGPFGFSKTGFRPVTEAFQGATPDLSHVVLSIDVPLTKATATAPEAAGLYEWSAAEPPAEQLQLVSVLPASEGGGPAGQYEFGSGLGAGDEARNAISGDGSRIVWEGQNHALYMRDTALGETVRLDAVQGGSGRTPEENPGEQPPSGEEAQPEAQFDMASSDGSMVFFTDTQRLTADSRAGESGPDTKFREPDLYACQMVEVEEAGHKKPKCDLTDLTPDTNPGEERAAVQGAVLSASEDGSYVYFIANGVLGDGAEHGASTGDCGVTSGGGDAKETEELYENATCNLYVEHYNGASEKWEAPRYIATLSGDDSPDWAWADLQEHTSGASPDGRYLAFMSQRSLTGYDSSDLHEEAEYVNADEEHVKRTGPYPQDQEVYLYDAATNRLVCASCNPTGARPDGERYFSPAQEAYEEKENMRFVGGYEVWPDYQWLAANVPGWVNHSVRRGAHQPRYLSNSGRLFFNSHDALVPQDVNGEWDVYEYEPPGEGDCTTSTQSASDVYSPKAEGCVGLISSGESSEESAFLDASESGGDVFFATLSQLVPQDVEHSMAVYDAHECTSAAPCFPPSAQTPPPCTTEASCKPAPEPQPAIYAAPSSATFAGPGNLAPLPPAVVKPKTKTVKCVKGKHLSHNKCVKTKHKKKKTKGKKSSKSNRGGKS
jgi:hypothetical protein